jgi:DNA polymerase-3 subunit delta
MGQPPPSVYYLTGDDEFSIDEFIELLVGKLEETGSADLNLLRMDASSSDLDSVAEVSSTLPFLTTRRMIVLDHVEKISGNKAQVRSLLDILDQLPVSTALILIEHDTPGRSRKKQKTSPVLSWVRENPDSSFHRQFIVPQGEAFVQWIQERCQFLGGEISPDAARYLAEQVEGDLRYANSELTKMLAYVDWKRRIELDDIELLTPFHGEGDVFALVDSIGLQEHDRAQHQLSHLLRTEDPRFVFSMIIRQFRLIIQVRDSLDRGVDPAEGLGNLRFLSPRLSTQARNFSSGELEDILRDLHQIDLDIKTGKNELDVALEVFLASFQTDPTIL